jgi:MFS family permease
MLTSSLDAAIQSINAAMTPAVLFTASALLLAGLQNKYSTLIQAVRALNDERRELLRRLTLANWEKSRSESIVEQIPHLLARAKLVRNAVFMLYLGTLLFLLSSFVIGLAHLGWPPMATLVVVLFGLGLAGLMVGVGFALAEARLSYRVVRMEVGLKAIGQ